MNKLLVYGAAAATAILSTSSVSGQTWQTVLDYPSASAYSIGADSQGHVLSAGDSSNAGIALTTDTDQLALGNLSAVWTLSDNTLLDNPDIDPTQYSSDIYSCGYDSVGNVYSVGQLRPKSSTTGAAYWYVRKSADGGQNWATVDLYQYQTGEFNWPSGFAADASGSIYVVGEGSSTSKTGGKKVVHWLVRRSSDGGQTWTPVDDLPDYGACTAAVVPSAGVFVAGPYFAGTWLVRKSVTGNLGTWSTVDGPIANASAGGVCGDSLGSVYVAGERFIASGSYKGSTTGTRVWMTRRSSDGGTTWTTDDSFTLVLPAQNQNTPGAWATGAATDPAGNAVVVGYASDGTYNHWIVRRRDVATGQWTTLDDFQPGNGAEARAVVTDAAGHLLVTGNANWGDGTGGHWIVRRY